MSSCTSTLNVHVPGPPEQLQAPHVIPVSSVAVPTRVGPAPVPSTVLGKPAGHCVIVPPGSAFETHRRNGMTGGSMQRSPFMHTDFDPEYPHSCARLVVI